ncbi:GTP-binding protein [Prochlorococcus marinus]|uniref:GTP-binding protein n=1 Tax=Prochlorococcus marinus XMU1408 TaxID=2213228 RepID=A0A318QXV1_PROMR|nr:GTP-binding protein [Prochlorococcus marinus]MBW3042619.1 GTP-binding protein [Prochlorococcus marinus str. XMU1408]PYE01315.1 GTP-binding protein [Prochlorococcus marinus XMU1408]
MIKNINMPKKCKFILNEWKKTLNLTNYEKKKFETLLNQLDFQINKLEKKELQISVYGRVGVGKSSLLNALIEKQVFKTDIINGNTKKIKSYKWGKVFKSLNKIELIDSPGIDEINKHKREEEINFNYLLDTDLILFVIDSDITRIELDSIEKLLKQNKPILIVLNRCDQWNERETKLIISSITKKLSFYKQKVEIALVASSPREAKIKLDGTVRSYQKSPKIDFLKSELQDIIDQSGELLLCINSLRLADQFYKLLKENRLLKKKEAAQSLIGKYAAFKASGVAINPFLMVDLFAGIGCDSALVIQLSQLYGLEVGGSAARELVKKLSLQNSLLGGVQIGIQITLNFLKHILILASPLTGGLSLAPATPVAIAQAALAIHATKRIGRHAAYKFLISTNRKDGRPRLMLDYLLRKNTDLRIMLGDFRFLASKSNKNKKHLLP